MQAIPQPPQLLVSLEVSTHEPLHIVSLPEHAHDPLTHGASNGHVLPHWPQLFGSDETSTHDPLHIRPLHVDPPASFPFPSCGAASFWCSASWEPSAATPTAHPPRRRTKGNGQTRVIFVCMPLHVRVARFSSRKMQDSLPLEFFHRPVSHPSHVPLLESTHDTEGCDRDARRELLRGGEVEDDPHGDA